ncbi:hypothetical protein DB32_000730 [Sandaracinus amylolyticus]|uniref:Uncharacterized protein n=1 Tax=Sandaracinus amylolyticus TaxID=927083 RepID=A0A0F6VZH1_9BACT|nr:hypothetical protein DB32_000730 [Sandaracinus amylolyticus]
MSIDVDAAYRLAGDRHASDVTIATATSEVARSVGRPRYETA